MITFEAVAKRYRNGREALSNISLHLAPGEMVFLTGRSGAGKSTVLKLIALKNRPTAIFAANDSMAIGVLSAESQTIAWMVIFFFASPAASSAYLTVSETFPLEVRALAIALFYAVGTGIGGVAGPALFGALIDTGSRDSVFAGYLLGSGLMIGAAVIAWRYCIAAERQPLESVARPLAFVE